MPLSKIQVADWIENSQNLYICIISLDERYLYFNDFFYKKFSSSFPVIVGEIAYFSLHPDDIGVAEKAAEECLRINGTVTVLLRKIQEKNRYYMTKWEFSPYKENDSVIGFFCIGFDITEQEELRIGNKKIQIYNAFLKEFIHILAHDLKQPMRTAGSFIKLIYNSLKGRNVPLTENEESYFEFVFEAITQSNKLTDNIQKVIQASTTENLLPENIQLGEVLNEIKSNIQYLYIDTTPTIELEKDATLLTYKLQLKQILQNLITNAVKFRRKDTPLAIKIDAENINGSIVFSVQDNGIGINEKYKGKIFNIFNRINPDIEGSGIGLSICKKILINTGGDIWVESKEGEGSTFYFTFGKTNI